MSQWNQLETQLRSWKPRKPAPRLQRNLFAPHAERRAKAGRRIPPARSWRVFLPECLLRTVQAGRAALLHLSHTWKWLAPATVCGLVVLVAVSPRDPGKHLGVMPTNAVLALASDLAVSNSQTALGVSESVSLSPTDRNLQWNVWASASFDWTNGYQSSSSNGSLPRVRENE